MMHVGLWHWDVFGLLGFVTMLKMCDMFEPLLSMFEWWLAIAPSPRKWLQKEQKQCRDPVSATQVMSCEEELLTITRGIWTKTCWYLYIYLFIYIGSRCVCVLKHDWLWWTHALLCPHSIYSSMVMAPTSFSRVAGWNQKPGKTYSNTVFCFLLNVCFHMRVVRKTCVVPEFCQGKIRRESPNLEWKRQWFPSDFRFVWPGARTTLTGSTCMCHS